VLAGTAEEAEEKVARGGYVISPAKGEAEGILIATGSEVHLAVEAQKALADQGKDVSVVSLPSFEIFEKQSAEYKETVLPKAVTKRVAIEAASPFGWERYVGTEGTSHYDRSFRCFCSRKQNLRRVWLHSRKCCGYFPIN
jgi:transketolase